MITKPWHGVSIGEEAPEIVTTFVEIVPSDTVKYELDKTTGLLKIDRPQQYSNATIWFAHRPLGVTRSHGREEARHEERGGGSRQGVGPRASSTATAAAAL